MGRIVVDVDGVNLIELINKVAENGYSLRVGMNVTLPKHYPCQPSSVAGRQYSDTERDANHWNSATDPHSWLQDNIDCESGIIFDNDEDKTDSAALLPCIEQAREGIRTLCQLQLLHQNR